MNALSAKQHYSLNPKPEIERLERGPAYGDPLPLETNAGPQDWPFLRGDISRSSYAPITLSGQPKQRWAVEFNGDLTSPIAAGGTIYLAEKTTDTVFALDVESGAKQWSYTANGEVDSPPAYACGHVVFGSRDGHVYCLNAKSGALRWRFLAAEQDKRLFNFEQLESVWPVFGSVLVLDRQVCFTAGRSLFLDGGITFYKLDLATGGILAQRRWDQRGPSGENYHAKVERLSMPAANNDVLSSNGKHIFMSSQVVTMDGERIMTEVGARHNVDEHSHIFSPSGLLDDSWWHRSYVAYGNGVSGGAGWGSTLKAVIGGKIMCADEKNIYSFGRKSKYNRWTLPLEFQLASTSKRQGKPKVKGGQDKADETENGNKGKKRKKAGKPTPDLSNPFLVNWSTTIPLWVKAMFVTKDKVVIAGPRDLYDEETAVASFNQNDKRFSLQQEHMEGKHGSLLKVIDKTNGEEVHSAELAFMPTFDGMITAEGKIFMTTSDGQVVCFDFQTRQ
jgi:outer membrane protein assembly factor BamB